MRPSMRNNNRCHCFPPLSRLNRAHPGKDTTYVLDFADSADEVLNAFSQYHGEAMLESISDPNLVYDLRAKLDAAGHYDDYEIDRVVRVQLDVHARHGDLVAAVKPVAQRLVTEYSAAKRSAQETSDRHATNPDDASAARQTIDALDLFKKDMGTFLRVYAFLSQLFDYGNTDIEKRAIFFRYLMPLLDFGREREQVDLSKVVLTHHRLHSRGQFVYTLEQGQTLKPLTETGAGQVRDEERVPLEEIIQRVNDLFEGELSERDKLVYVNEVIKGKLLESATLRQQAQHNTRVQFESSPDLNEEITNAIMDAFEAHSEMSRQALDNPGSGPD